MPREPSTCFISHCHPSMVKKKLVLAKGDNSVYKKFYPINSRLACHLVRVESALVLSQEQWGMVVDMKKVMYVIYNSCFRDWFELRLLIICCLIVSCTPHKQISFFNRDTCCLFLRCPLHCRHFYQCRSFCFNQPRK